MVLLSAQGVSASLQSAFTQLQSNPSRLLTQHGHKLGLWLGVTLAIIFVLSLAARLAGTTLRTVLVFAYNCFLQPLGKTKNQTERLDRFYQNQATGEYIAQSVREEPDN